MIAPAAVDGRPLSHPDHDRLWAAFVDHGVTPVFHVADQPRVLDDAFYTDDPTTASCPVLESVFLWVPPAVAVTDLIVNGVLDRHPELAHRHRRAVVDLGAPVPDDARRRLGLHRPCSTAARRRRSSCDPSEYFRRQVRVSSFSYEQPGRLAAKSGDLFMCCSDYPHSEGTATPLADYAKQGSSLTMRPASSATTWRPSSGASRGPPGRGRAPPAPLGTADCLRSTDLSSADEPAPGQDTQALRG